MPIALEPDQKFPIVLESDQDKPASVRPVFWAKSQSMRGQAKIAKVLDRMRDDADVTAEQLFADAVNTLSEVLTGWEHMGGREFSPESLRDVLTYAEARELMRMVMFNQHLSGDEKKS